MTYHGVVKEGRVEFDGETPEDGSRVDVTVSPTPSVHPEADSAETPQTTLYEVMKGLIGKAEGLPPDFARNHDHYIHGAPKK